MSDKDPKFDVTDKDARLVEQTLRSLADSVEALRVADADKVSRRFAAAREKATTVETAAVREIASGIVVGVRKVIFAAVDWKGGDS